MKRRNGGDSITAITFADDGIAVARVKRVENGQPLLITAKFVRHGEEKRLKLDEVIKDLGLEGTRGTTLMNSGDYQLLLVEGPDVEPSELRAAIRWRIKDLIDFHIDDTVIDVFEIPGQPRGRARMMYVVAARTAKVQERISEVEDGDLDLVAVDIEELALRNIAALAPEHARGVAMLWLAPEYGLIVITRGGELYLSRRIEIGANAVFSAANEADPENGDYGETLLGLVDQITLEIQRSLDYYDSHFSQPPVQAVLVAPCVPEAPFLTDAIGAKLNFQVRALVLEELFPDSKVPDGPERARCLTAIGAALRVEEVAL